MSLSECLAGQRRWWVETGDSRAVMAAMPENSVDAVVTDPPYEIGFMQSTTKGWDSSGIAFDPEFWAGVLRVMKPGAAIMAFGATRTHHRMTCAIEDAGFEIRDEICDWVYSTGFPHSENVARNVEMYLCRQPGRHYDKRLPPEKRRIALDHLCPGDVRADRYRGLATALKPSREPIVIARKALDGTLAANALAWHVAGIFVDGGRIPMNDDDRDTINSMGGFGKASYVKGATQMAVGNGLEFTVNADAHPLGRWPANSMFQHAPDCSAAACVAGCPVRELNRQSGWSGPAGSLNGNEGRKADSIAMGGIGMHPFSAYGDTGGAGRFFYCPKPDRRERDYGCDDLPDRGVGDTVGRDADDLGLNSPSAGAGGRVGTVVKNHHPTVKPWELTKTLCAMAAPPNSLIFNPFGGSGSEGCGAMFAGQRYLCAELMPEYAEIARARIAAVQRLMERPETVREKGVPKAQLGLFGG